MSVSVVRLYSDLSDTLSVCLFDELVVRADELVRLPRAGFGGSLGFSAVHVPSIAGLFSGRVGGGGRVGFGGNSGFAEPSSRFDEVFSRSGAWTTFAP